MRRVIDGFQSATFFEDSTALIIYGTLFVVLIGALIHWYFFYR